MSGPADPTNQRPPRLFSAATTPARLSNAAWTQPLFPSARAPRPIRDSAKAHTRSPSRQPIRPGRKAALPHMPGRSIRPPRRNRRSTPFEAEPSPRATRASRLYHGDRRHPALSARRSRLRGVHESDRVHGLALGSHTFQVKTRDAAGNDSSGASRTWSIDASGPSVTSRAHRQIRRTAQEPASASSPTRPEAHSNAGSMAVLPERARALRATSASPRVRTRSKSQPRIPPATRGRLPRRPGTSTSRHLPSASTLPLTARRSQTTHRRSAETAARSPATRPM